MHTCAFVCVYVCDVCASCAFVSVCAGSKVQGRMNYKKKSFTIIRSITKLNRFCFLQGAKLKAGWMQNVDQQHLLWLKYRQAAGARTRAKPS